MSHFLIYVLVSGETKSIDIESKVGELLAPYSESIQVDEYDRKCYCIGQEAKNAGRAAENFKPFSTLRQEFHEQHTDLVKRIDALEWRGAEESEPGEYKRLSKERDRLWKAHTANYNRIEKETAEAHPMFIEPSSGCSSCGGSGKYKSNYNPKSKWDWYRIGGRWDGVVKSRKRDSKDNGFNFSSDHELLQHNVAPVSHFPQPIPDESIPFAILTPDGKWYERGKMGWFGAVSNKNESWKNQARKLLSKHSSCLAVGCDLHI